MSKEKVEHTVGHTCPTDGDANVLTCLDVPETHLVGVLVVRLHKVNVTRIAAHVDKYTDATSDLDHACMSARAIFFSGGTYKRMNSGRDSCFTNLEKFNTLNNLPLLKTIFQETVLILNVNKEKCDLESDKYLIKRFVEFLTKITEQIEELHTYATNSILQLVHETPTTEEETASLKNDMLNVLDVLRDKLQEFVTTTVPQSTSSNAPVPAGKRPRTNQTRSEMSLYRAAEPPLQAPIHLQQLTGLMQQFTRVNQEFRNICYNLSSHFTTIIANIHRDIARLEQIKVCCKNMTVEDPEDLELLRVALRSVISGARYDPVDGNETMITQAGPERKVEDGDAEGDAPKEAMDETSRSEMRLSTKLLEFWEPHYRSSASNNRSVELRTLQVTWQKRSYIEFLRSEFDKLTAEDWKKIKFLPLPYQLALPSPITLVDRCLIIAPTGTGKTLMVCETMRLLMQTASNNRKSILVVVEDKPVSTKIDHYDEAEWLTVGVVVRDTKSKHVIGRAHFDNAPKLSAYEDISEDLTPLEGIENLRAGLAWGEKIVDDDMKIVAVDTTWYFKPNYKNLPIYIEIANKEAKAFPFDDTLALVAVAYATTLDIDVSDPKPLGDVKRDSETVDFMEIASILSRANQGYIIGIDTEGSPWLKCNNTYITKKDNKLSPAKEMFYSRVLNLPLCLWCAETGKLFVYRGEPPTRDQIKEVNESISGLALLHNLNAENAESIVRDITKYDSNNKCIYVSTVKRLREKAFGRYVISDDTLRNVLRECHLIVDEFHKFVEAADDNVVKKKIGELQLTEDNEEREISDLLEYLPQVSSKSILYFLGGSMTTNQERKTLVLAKHKTSIHAKLQTYEKAKDVESFSLENSGGMGRGDGKVHKFTPSLDAVDGTTPADGPSEIHARIRKGENELLLVQWYYAARLAHLLPPGIHELCQNSSTWQNLGTNEDFGDNNTPKYYHVLFIMSLFNEDRAHPLFASYANVIKCFTTLNKQGFLAGYKVAQGDRLTTTTTVATESGNVNVLDVLTLSQQKEYKLTNCLENRDFVSYFTLTANADGTKIVGLTATPNARTCPLFFAKTPSSRLFVAKDGEVASRAAIKKFYTQAEEFRLHYGDAYVSAITAKYVHRLLPPGVLNLQTAQTAGACDYVTTEFMMGMPTDKGSGRIDNLLSLLKPIFEENLKTLIIIDDECEAAIGLKYNNIKANIESMCGNARPFFEGANALGDFNGTTDSTEFDAKRDNRKLHDIAKQLHIAFKSKDRGGQFANSYGNTVVGAGERCEADFTEAIRGVAALRASHEELRNKLNEFINTDNKKVMIGRFSDIGTGKNFKGVRNLVKVGFYIKGDQRDEKGMKKIIESVTQANGRGRRIDSALALPSASAYRDVKMYWIPGCEENELNKFQAALCDAIDKPVCITQGECMFNDETLRKLTSAQAYRDAEDWYLEKNASSSRSEQHLLGMLWNAEAMSGTLKMVRMV